MNHTRHRERAAHAVLLLFALTLTACSTMRTTTSTTEQTSAKQQATGTSDRSIDVTTTETQTDNGESVTTETTTTTIYSKPDTITGAQYVVETSVRHRETRKQNNTKTETTKQAKGTASDSLRIESDNQSHIQHADSTAETKGATQINGRSGYDKFVSWGFWILLGFFILVIIGFVIYICIKIR